MPGPGHGVEKRQTNFRPEMWADLLSSVCQGCLHPTVLAGLEGGQQQ